MKPLFALSNTEARELAKNHMGMPKNENTEFFSCYFHGKLEDRFRFDLVSLIDGTVPKLKLGTTIPSKVFLHEEDKIIDCTMVVGKYKPSWKKDWFYVLIVEPDEVEELLKKNKAEGGLVYFKE